MAHMNHLGEKRRCSDCHRHSHSHEQAGMDPRVSHFDPLMSSRMKPSMCAAKTPQRPYDGHSTHNFGSFREPKHYHDPASNCRVCPTPSLYNAEEYGNHECLSCRCAVYSGTGIFHNGGNSPVVEASNSGATFGPMNNEQIIMLGRDSAALPSWFNIYSMSPASVATPLHRNLLSERVVHGDDAWSQGKQVTLHKWFLIRAPNIDVSTTNKMKNIGVCLGGLVRFGSQHSQLVRTSAVAERVENCKLRALDGTEIHLVGCIDEQKTIANGFSVLVTRIFCSGFPCTWRHFLAESSVMAPADEAKTGAPVEFDNCESASNGESEYDGAFTSSMGTTVDRVRQARSIPSVLCSTPCSEMLREDQGRAAYQRDFGDRISKLYSDIEGADLDHMDYTNTKEEGYVSSCPVKYTEPNSLSEPYDSDLPLDLKRKLDESSGQLVDLEVKGYRPGQTDNDATCHVDKGTFLDVTPSPLPSGCHTFDESLGLSHKNGAIPTGESLEPTNFYAGVGCSSDTDIEHDVQVGDLVLKTDQPSSTPLKLCATNVCEIHIDASSHAELEGKENDVEAAPILSDVDFISHDVSKASKDCSFEPKLRYSKRLRKEGPGVEVCIKPIDQTSDTGQRVSKREKFGGKTSKTYRKPIEEEGSILSNRVLTKGQDDCVYRSKAVDPQKSIKHQTMTKKASAKHTCVQVSEPFVPLGDCEAGHHHKGHPDTAASTQAKDKASRLQEAQVPSLPLIPVQTHKTRRHARYDRNSSEQTQAQSKSTIKTRHYKSSILPPPLPPSRVNVSKDQIMRAYGLKMSRSGRLLVPPLAYWRNQTLAHDMDGRIIAILEGFEERPADTGCYNFKPPVEKTAVNLQEELCAAAAVIPNRSKKKRKC